MRFLVHRNNLSFLISQRKFLLGLSGVLLSLVFLQGLLLFFKSERIILIPPDLKEAAVIEQGQFSKTYLEAMALFFAHCLLDVSEATIKLQGETVLRVVAPESYGVFKAQLLKEEKRLKEQQLSLQFCPQRLEFQKPLVIDVQGVLKRFVGAHPLVEVQETYRIEFGVRFGRLFLVSFEVIQSNQETLQPENPDE